MSGTSNNFIIISLPRADIIHHILFLDYNVKDLAVYQTMYCIVQNFGGGKFEFPVRQLNFNLISVMALTVHA